MIALNPDTIRYYYLFSLTQDDNKLSGEIVVRDSTVQEKGFINGVVEQDSIFFSTNFNDDKLNFSFKGILDNSSNQSELSGFINPNLLSIGGNDEMIIIINNSNNVRFLDSRRVEPDSLL